MLPEECPYCGKAFESVYENDSSEENMWDVHCFNCERIIEPCMVAKYQLLKRLGKGGMGEVYLAGDTDLGRLVAIKFILPKYVSDQELAKRFRREALALANINHSNICPIYEFGQENGHRFIVMPYIKGETLRAYIERMKAGPKNLTECLKIVIQVVKGVSVAHKLGMVHRDIKPENIMISEDGTVKVMDFGLVKLVHKETSSISGLVGTPPYMSPEQVREEKNLDDRSDIFSMGIILYEMFTGGRHPFIGDTGSATMKAIEKRNPPPLKKFWSETPSSLQQIVNKALKKNKKLRHQNAEDLLISLEEVEKQMKDGQVKTESPISRHPYYLAILALLIVIALALTINFFVTTRNSGASNQNNSNQNNLGTDERRITLLVGQTVEVFGQDLSLTLIQIPNTDSPSQNELIVEITSADYPKMIIAHEDFSSKSIYTYKGKHEFDIRILGVDKSSATFGVTQK